MAHFTHIVGSVELGTSSIEYGSRVDGGTTDSLTLSVRSITTVSVAGSWNGGRVEGE